MKEKLIFYDFGMEIISDSWFRVSSFVHVFFALSPVFMLFLRYLWNESKNKHFSDRKNNFFALVDIKKCLRGNCNLIEIKLDREFLFVWEEKMVVKIVAKNVIMRKLICSTFDCFRFGHFSLLYEFLKFLHVSIFNFFFRRHILSHTFNH